MLCLNEFYHTVFCILSVSSTKRAKKSDLESAAVQVNQQLTSKIQRQLDNLTQVIQISNLPHSIRFINNEDASAQFQALSQVFKTQTHKNYVQTAIKYQNQFWSDQKNSNQALNHHLNQYLNKLANINLAAKPHLIIESNQLVLISPVFSPNSAIQAQPTSRNPDNNLGYLALILKPEWLIQNTGFYLTNNQKNIIAAPNSIQTSEPNFNHQFKFAPKLAELTPTTNWQLVSATTVSKPTYAEKQFGLVIFISILIIGTIALLPSRMLWLYSNAIQQLTNHVLALNRNDKLATPSFKNFPREFHPLIKAFDSLKKRLVRKNARIQTQKKQLNRALNIAKIGTFELHCDTLKLYCSDTLVDIFSLSETPKYTDLFTVLPEPYAELISEALEKLIQPSSKHQAEFFNCHLRPDQKTEQHLHIRFEKLKIDNHSIILGCVNDISEIKNTEHNLAHSLERLAYAQEATNDGIWDWDIVNNQVYISARWRQMLGYQANELDSSLETLQALIHPIDTDKVLASTNELLEGKASSFVQEFRMKHKSGEYIWILCRAKVFASDQDNKPLRMIGSNTDITHRKQTEHKLTVLNDELEQRVEQRTKQLELSNLALTDAKDKAEQANKIKSEFLANMSHEIRTPLNAIIGLTNLISKSQLDAEQRNRINNIHLASDNLLSIINDILDFSKIEAGKLKIERIQFNLADIITGVSHLLAHKAHQKGLEFIVNVEPNVPFSLVGDPNRLNQILLNLVSNAIKFTEQGEIELLVRLKTCSDLNARIEFAVTDTGIGLTQEQQINLFKSFTQADNSTSRKYGGTGLGLTICRQLCQLMQGEITVNSQVNQGATFSFELPFSLNNILQPIYQFDQLIYPEYPVLLIEPNPKLSQLVSQNLATFGYTTLTCDNIQVALSNLNNQSEFKLVIVDYDKMNEQPGLFEQLRNTLACEHAYFVIQHNSVKPSALPKMERAENINKPLHIWDLYRLISQSDQTSDVQIASSTPNQTTKGVSLDILVVEDNEINQEVAKALLTYHGFKITLADNGKQALEKLSKQDFALILMDIQMPEMDGYQATREIRKIEQYKRLPIIAMTANAMPEDKEKCIENGMNDHVAKPINEADLLSTISNWLGQNFTSQSGNKSTNTSNATASELNQTVEDSALTAAPYANLSYTLNQFSGNHELTQKMLKRFVEDNQNSDQKINTFIESQQNHNAQQLIHSIKGVSGNLGLQKLHLACKHFENALTQNPNQQSNNAIEYWSAQYSNVLHETINQLNQQMLAQSNQKTPDQQQESIDFDEVLPHLTALKQKLEQDEFITQADTQTIQSLSQALEVKDLYQSLIHQLEIFDNEAAIDTLQQLIQYCQQQD